MRFFLFALSIWLIINLFSSGTAQPVELLQSGTRGAGHSRPRPTFVPGLRPHPHPTGPTPVPGLRPPGIFHRFQ